jgi:uncharacterized membrane protein YvlD (DUF360 family)
MVMLADKLVEGIHIQGFLWAFIFGILLSLITSALINMEKKLR